MFLQLTYKKTSLYKHTIDTGDSKPIKCRPYRTSPAAKQEIQRQIDEMLKNDIIEHSTSEYSFPIVLVKRKTVNLDSQLIIEN